jgi:hypothetical protein
VLCDRQWKQGRAQLGFGDGDEVTLLTRSSPVSLFRATFTVSDADVRDTFLVTASVVADDGAAVFLNAVEGSRRENLPEGVALTASTLAMTKKSVPIEGEFSNPILWSGRSLLVGTNVIAVQVHQASLSMTGADLSFDLKLERITFGSTVPSEIEYPPSPSSTPSESSSMSAVPSISTSAVATPSTTPSQSPSPMESPGTSESPSRSPYTRNAAARASTAGSGSGSLTPDATAAVTVCVIVVVIVAVGAVVVLRVRQLRRRRSARAHDDAAQLLSPIVVSRGGGGASGRQAVNAAASPDEQPTTVRGASEKDRLPLDWRQHQMGHAPVGRRDGARGVFALRRDQRQWRGGAGGVGIGVSGVGDDLDDGASWLSDGGVVLEGAGTATKRGHPRRAVEVTCHSSLCCRWLLLLPSRTSASHYYPLFVCLCRTPAQARSHSQVTGGMRGHRGMYYRTAAWM